MRDDVRHADGLVTHVSRLQAISAHAFRRKTRPTNSFLQQFRRLHAWKQNALRSAIQRPRYQRILQVGDPHDRAQAGFVRRANQVLQRFEIEAAVFGIEVAPVETGRRQNPWNLGGAQHRSVAPELSLALLEGLFNGVNAHELDSINAMVGTHWLDRIRQPVDQVQTVLRQERQDRIEPFLGMAVRIEHRS